jgi:hypothetical protein
MDSPSKLIFRSAKDKARLERELTEHLFSLRTVVDGQKTPPPTLEEALDLWGHKMEDLIWDNNKKQQLMLKLKPDAD